MDIIWMEIIDTKKGQSRQLEARGSSYYGNLYTYTYSDKTIGKARADTNKQYRKENYGKQIPVSKWRKQAIKIFAAGFQFIKLWSKLKQ